MRAIPAPFLPASALLISALAPVIPAQAGIQLVLIFFRKV